MIVAPPKSSKFNLGYIEDFFAIFFQYGAKTKSSLLDRSLWLNSVGYNYLSSLSKEKFTEGVLDIQNPEQEVW